MSRKVTIELTDQDNENLESVVASTGLSPNDAIRQALTTEAFIQKMLSEGKQFIVQDSMEFMQKVDFVK